MVNRLFEILYILLKNKKTTASFLADHFEVSTRTIYRDIDKLSYAGFPIYTNQGSNGGIYINDEFTFDKSILTKEDQELIVLGLNSIKHNNNNYNYQIDKLTNYFNAPEKEWLEIEESNWSNSDDKFKIVKEAIFTSHAISFNYYNNSNEASFRQIYPLVILNKANQWYVKSYCLNKKEYRIFKLNRIQNILIGIDTFDDNKYRLNLPGNNYPLLKHVKLELSFSINVAYRIYDEFDIADITKLEDRFIIKCELADNDWLINYLLGFGDNLEVIKPEKIKVKLIEKIKNINTIYDI